MYRSFLSLAQWELLGALHPLFFWWALPNVYAQAMTSMKVWMIIVSFAAAHTYLWSDDESYVTSIIMTFALLLVGCIYAWDNNIIRLPCPGKEDEKPDHAAGKRRMDGSFSCQSIPRMLTVCTFTLWLMVKNGRSITFPPWTMVYRLSIMTLWARGIMPRFARREEQKSLCTLFENGRKSLFLVQEGEPPLNLEPLESIIFGIFFSLTSSLTV